MVEARICVMFLRSKIRRKDGKDHRAWSVVENRRVHELATMQMIDVELSIKGFLHI